MTPEAREFHLEEYRQIRAEVLSLHSRTDLIFRGTLVAAAAVAAWIATSAVVSVNGEMCTRFVTHNFGTAMTWLPCAVLITAVVAGAANLARMKHFGSYLRKLEVALGDDALGWEAHLQGTMPVTFASAVATWLVALLATVLFALYLPEYFGAYGACGR